MLSFYDTKIERLNKYLKMGGYRVSGGLIEIVFEVILDEYRIISYLNKHFYGNEIKGEIAGIRFSEGFINETLVDRTGKRPIKLKLVAKVED